MEGLVPGDEFGKTRRYRHVRLVLQVGEVLVPACWALLAEDGSVYFGIAMGETAMTDTGTAVIGPEGKVIFTTRDSLEHVQLEHRRNVHVSLHPSGACHVRVGKAPPIEKHRIENWYPVIKELIWLNAYTAPLSSLPTITAKRTRDAVLPFPSLDVSTRIQAAIYPRTKDASVPLISDKLHTLSGIGPHYILRLTIDVHSPVTPTIVVFEKYQDPPDEKS